MGEYMFGSGKVKINARDRKKLDRIARKHGAEFTNPTMPGDGPIYWFACPNRGNPFDAAVRDAVMRDAQPILDAVAKGASK